MTVIFTLLEGTYHHGAAALCNSLVAANFQGLVIIGHRGSVPPWLAAGPLQPTEGMAIRAEPLDTPVHLTNYKADFALQVARKLCPTAEQVFYADPDVFIKREWQYFEHWVRTGVCLVEDVNPRMPANHPVRAAWRRFLQEQGFPSEKPLDAFYNGGFFGFQRESISFIERWRLLMKAGEQCGFDPSAFAQRMNNGLFLQQPDQDFLNMAAMSAPEPLSSVGPQEMDFFPGGTLMSHAIGAPKPWQKNFLKEALHGRPPSMADKGFWRHAAGPIQTFPLSIQRRRSFEIRLSALLGRFYRRG